LSQKPAADEFNYILNNYGEYIKYLVEEKVTEFLEKSENLNDLPNKATARTNLDVFSKSEVNSKQINTGAGLQGGGDLSANRTISMATPSTVGAGSNNSATNSGSPTHTHALDATGNVTVLTGSILHGGTIPLPAGYSQAQCRWTVSINQIGVKNDNTLDLLTCSVDSNRVVTIVMSGTDTGTITGSANYIIVGVK
ncbi:MAG: hypothetical protein ACRC6V_12045, partial [Bacteroidales bacterium]